MCMQLNKSCVFLFSESMVKCVCSLCKYDLRKDNLFVLGWVRGQRVSFCKVFCNSGGVFVVYLVLLNVICFLSLKWVCTLLVCVVDVECFV